MNTNLSAKKNHMNDRFVPICSQNVGILINTKKFICGTFRIPWFGSPSLVSITFTSLYVLRLQIQNISKRKLLVLTDNIEAMMDNIEPMSKFEGIGNKCFAVLIQILIYWLQQKE